MTQPPTDLESKTPVEVDTFLSENYQEQAKLWASIGSQVKHIDSLKARLAKAHDIHVMGLIHEIDEANARLEELRAASLDLTVASAPYRVEYDRRPWNRYFLVDNANGHVHRGMDCSTCFPGTRYTWLVDLADCDENAMIEEWGERACTVCFPSAPTNPNYNRPARIDREAQEARAAEKAAKDAVKAEKTITDIDGSPLRVEGGVLKTKVAARNALSSLFQDVVFYGQSRPAVDIRKLVPALEAAGVDWVPVAERAIKKAVKESEIPAHNPFRLTPEQIEAHEADIKANAATAQALLKEVVA